MALRDDDDEFEPHHDIEAVVRAHLLAAERLARLQALTSTLSRLAGIHDVAAAAVQQLRSTLGMAAGAILVVGPGGDTLELVSHAGLLASQLVHSVSIHDARAACTAARTGEPLWLRGATEIQEHAPLTGSVITGTRVGAVAALPLRIDERVIGAMTLGFPGPRAFTEDERAFALTVADLCAQALDRARLYDTATRARAEAEAAIRAKDDLLATINHALRTPLTAILGWAEMLRAGALTPEATARAVAAIARNARGQARLIDGLTAGSEGEGRGASFTGLLPARTADDPFAGDGPSPAPPRLDGVGVLVVDDDLETREMIAAALGAQGAAVALAASVIEALRAVARSAPDVLVSDIGMPDEDGYALLRRVRAVSAVPALALTAHAGTHDARMAELAGFDRYLAKPVTPMRLVEAVAGLAGRSAR